MDQLRCTGLHEDGRHAVLTAADGSEFLVAIDDRLRAAVRRRSMVGAPRSAPATPREVQTQIRGGASTEEVAESTGWTVERIERYEGPILAEREYVASLARAALIRTHERGETPPTLESRARERLDKRGVDLAQVSWDSIRPAGGGWSVQVHFKAGQRARSASWSFEPDTRSVDAIDDEARWLSEDEQSLPAGGAAAALLGGTSDAPDDLMSAMRERSKRRVAPSRRRKAATPQPGEESAEAREHTPAADPAEMADGLDIATGGQVSEHPSAVPGQQDIPHQALPLEDLPYDPDTMGLPPAAGGERAQDEVDAGDTEVDGVEVGNAEVDGVDEVSDEDVGDEDDAADFLDGGADQLELEHEATLADFFGSDDDLDDDAAEDGVDDSGMNGDDVENPDVEEGRVDEARATQAEPVVKSPPRGRKGRPSVPSWDDIMFGTKESGR